ncbi:Cysteine protease atg4b, partial [Dissophora globulifera]
VVPAQEGFEGDEDVPALAEIITTSKVAPVQEGYEGDEVDENALAPTEVLATSEVAPAQEEDEGDEDMTAFPDILALPEIFGTPEVAPPQDRVEGHADVAASTELAAISNVAPASEEDEGVVEDIDALTESLANLDAELHHTRDECKEDTSASKDVPVTSEVIPVYGREQGDEDASAFIDASTDPDEQGTVARKDALVKSEATPMDTTTTGTDSPIVQATAEKDKNHSNEAPGDTADDVMNTEAVRADAGDSENGPEAASMSGTATPPVRESQVQLQQSPEVRSSPEAQSSSSPEARSSSSPEARSPPRQGNKGQKRKQKGKVSPSRFRYWISTNKFVQQYVVRDDRNRARTVFQTEDIWLLGICYSFEAGESTCSLPEMPRIRKISTLQAHMLPTRGETRTNDGGALSDNSRDSKRGRERKLGQVFISPNFLSSNDPILDHGILVEGSEGASGRSRSEGRHLEKQREKELAKARKEEKAREKARIKEQDKLLKFKAKISHPHFESNNILHRTKDLPDITGVDFKGPGDVLAHPDTGRRSRSVHGYEKEEQPQAAPSDFTAGPGESRLNVIRRMQSISILPKAPTAAPDRPGQKKSALDQHAHVLSDRTHQPRSQSISNVSVFSQRSTGTLSVSSHEVPSSRVRPSSPLPSSLKTSVSIHEALAVGPKPIIMSKLPQSSLNQKKLPDLPPAGLDDIPDILNYSNRDQDLHDLDGLEITIPVHVPSIPDKGFVEPVPSSPTGSISSRRRMTISSVFSKDPKPQSVSGIAAFKNLVNASKASLRPKTDSATSLSRPQSPKASGPTAPTITFGPQPTTGREGSSHSKRAGVTKNMQHWFERQLSSSNNLHQQFLAATDEPVPNLPKDVTLSPPASPFPVRTADNFTDSLDERLSNRRIAKGTTSFADPIALPPLLPESPSETFVLLYQGQDTPHLPLDRSHDGSTLVSVTGPDDQTAHSIPASQPFPGSQTDVNSIQKGNQRLFEQLAAFSNEKDERLSDLASEWESLWPSKKDQDSLSPNSNPVRDASGFVHVQKAKDTTLPFKNYDELASSDRERIRKIGSAYVKIKGPRPEIVAPQAKVPATFRGPVFQEEPAEEEPLARSSGGSTASVEEKPSSAKSRMPNSAIKVLAALPLEASPSSPTPSLGRSWRPASPRSQSPRQSLAQVSSSASASSSSASALPGSETKEDAFIDEGKTTHIDMSSRINGYPLPSHSSANHTTLEKSRSAFNLTTNQSTLLQFTEDFQSRLWFTYRKDLHRIEPSAFTSDAGWGCMIRTGQSLLAQAFIHVFLGREWRMQFSPSEDDAQKYRMILGWFADEPDRYYSIHNIARQGQALEKRIGEWFGPSTVAHALQRLSKKHADCPVTIMVSMDNTIRASDVAQSATGGVGGFSSVGTNSSGIGLEHWKPVVLLIPSRYGSDKLYEKYTANLKGLYKLPQFLGIAGGRPGRSLYFVATQGNELFYFDPHFPRTRASQEELSRYPAKSFHCDVVRAMDIMELDPSMMLGFLIRSSSDLANLSMRLKTDMEKGYPLLTILEDIPLSIPVEPIQDVKLVPSEPVAVVKAERHTLLPSRAAIPRPVTPPAILQGARIVDYELLRGSVDQAFSRPTLDQEEQVRRYVETEPAIARSFIQRIPTSNLAADSTVDQAVTEDLRHKNEMHAIREEREFDTIIETTVVHDHHADSKIGGSTDSSTLALPNSLYDDQHSDLEVSDELELNFEMTTTLSIDDQSTFEILNGKHTTAPSAQIRLEDAERHDLESIQEAVEADSTLGAVISLDHAEQQVDGNVYSDALTNVVQEQGHFGDEMVLKVNVESAASVIDNPEPESHDRAETLTPIISGTPEDEEQHSECDAQISPGTDSAAFLTTVLDVVTVMGTDNHLDPEHNVDTSALTQQASGSEDVNEIMAATSLGYSHDEDEDTTLPKLSTELPDRLSRDDLQQREEEEVGEAENSIDFMTTTTTGDQSEIEIGTLVDAESSVQPDSLNGIDSQPRLDAHGEGMLPSDMDSHSFTIGLSEREHESTSTTITPHHSFADDEFEPTTTGATFNSNHLQAESEEDLSTRPTDKENLADPTLPIDVAMDIDATQYHKEEAEEDEEDEENILEMDASANIIQDLQSRVSHSAEQKIPDLMISESDVAPLTQVSSEDSTQDTFVSSLQPLVDVSKLQGEDQMVDTGSLSLHSLLPSFDAPEKYIAASLSPVIPKIQAEPAPGNFYDAFESFFAADINLTAPDSLTTPTATKDYALENPVTTESSEPISAVELQDVVHKYGGQTFYDEFESAESDLQSDTQDYNLQAYYSEVEPTAAAPDALQERLGDSQGVAYVEDGSKLIPYSSEDAYEDQNLDVSANLPESVNEAFAVVGLPVLKESEPFSRPETNESKQDPTSVLNAVLDNSLRNNDETDAVSDQAEDSFESPTQTTMDSEGRFDPISFAANEDLLGYSSSQDAAYEWPGSVVKQELQGQDFLPDEPIIQDDIAATASEESLIFDHDSAESNDSVKPVSEPQPAGHQSMESLGQYGIEDEADYEDVLDEFGAEYEGESESEDIGDVTVMLDSTMGLHLPESSDVSQEFSRHGEQGLRQEIDADLDTTDAAFGSDYELGAELASSSNYLDVDMLSMLDDYLNEGDLDAPDAISTTFAEATPTDSKGSDSHSPIGAFVDILPQESFLHNGDSGSMDDDYPQDSTNVDFQHMDNHFCQVNDEDCRESTNNDDPQSTHHDHHPQIMDDGQQADALDTTVVLEVVGSAESMDESSANIDVSETKDYVANAEFKHYSEIASTNPEETEGKLVEQPAEDNTLAEADLNLGTTIENLVHYEDESKQDLITLIDKPAVFEATLVQGIEKGEWSGENAGSFTESLATSEVAPDQERESDKDVAEFVDSLEALEVAPVQERNEVDEDVTASTESLAISEMALAQEKDEGDEDIIALPEILATLKVAPTQERNESNDDVTASTEILAISEAAPIQERDEGDEDVTARMEIIALPEIRAISEVAPAQE